MIGSAALLVVAGAATAALLPLPFAWRAGLLACHFALTLPGLAGTLRAYRRAAGYRLYADGSIDVLHTAGGRQSAVYAAGSIVLPEIAWLCIRTAAGERWGELVAGKPRKNRDWRRLQVICRQIAAC